MELSRREQEVLDAVGERLSNPQIAALLFISVRTVESHVSSLLRKLDLPDRHALADHVDRRRHRPHGRGVGPPASPLLGRLDEQRALESALGAAAVVTVVGPAGVGKTRLAAEVAARRAAVLVELAGLVPGAGADSVAVAAADALGMAEPAGQGILEAVVGHLARSGALLVLDNCEHVLQGAAELAARVAGSPSGRVLATSRERLALPAERIVALGPLDEATAAALFVERARVADPAVELDPASVAKVCAGLDHLPLAIELAAARLAVLSLDDLVARLGEALALLSGGDRSNRRQWSVRATLAWSHDLLGEQEQALYRRVTVLPGPFRLAVAEAVAGGPPVASVAAALVRLVEASLVARHDDRYRMLELVRADGNERLDASGERDVVAGRLVSWAEDAVAAGVVAGDEADLRAAAEAAAEAGGARAGALLSGLALAWEARGWWTEAVLAHERAARASGGAHHAIHAGELAWSRWRGDDAVRLFHLAADLAATTGDAPVEAAAAASAVEVSSRFCGFLSAGHQEDELRSTLDRAQRASAAAGDASSACRVAVARSFMASHGGDLTTGQQAAEEASGLAERSGVATLRSAALDAVAAAAERRGDVATMLRVTEQRFALFDQIEGGGRADVERSDALSMAADGALALGDFPAALVRARAALAREMARELSHTGLARVSAAEFFLGRWDDAMEHTRAIESGWEADGRPAGSWIVLPLATAAAICAYRDDPAEDRWVALGAGLTSHSYEGAVRALRADALAYRGRADEAAAVVARRPEEIHGLWRATYAAVRAQVLGGPALDDAAPLVGASRFATAVLAAARGDVGAAHAGFTGCGAAFHAARTALGLGGEAARAAAEVLAAMGVEPARQAGGAAASLVGPP